MVGHPRKPKPDEPPINALADRKRRLLAAERTQALIQAADSLVRFTELTMPLSSDPENVKLSKYTPKRHHKALAAALEGVTFKAAGCVSSSPCRPVTARASWYRNAFPLGCWASGALANSRC